MRTSPPRLLPLFRSEMQVRLLALVLLQPEREWTLAQLAGALDAPQSSVHRELVRAVDAGILVRDTTARPHRFQAAEEDPLLESLATLLRVSVGVEAELRDALEGLQVDAAVIHGSWASGRRRPDSDIDVLVVGEADLRDLRRRTRPFGNAAGRRIDVTVLSTDEFRRLADQGASFVRGLLDGPVISLAGDLGSIARR